MDVLIVRVRLTTLDLVQNLWLETRCWWRQRGHYLHRTCCCLVKWEEPRSQTTMRRCSDDTTSCLPPGFAGGPKQTEERATWKHRRSHFPPTCQLSPSPPNNPGTPLAVSLCCLPAWPSCSCGSTPKVTLCTRRHCLSLPPYHTHTHTHIDFTVHTITDVYSLLLHRGLYSEWTFAVFQHRLHWSRKALQISNNSSLINWRGPQRLRLPSITCFQRGSLRHFCPMDPFENDFHRKRQYLVRKLSLKSSNGQLIGLSSKNLPKLIVSDCRLHWMWNGQQEFPSLV